MGLLSPVDAALNLRPIDHFFVIAMRSCKTLRLTWPNYVIFMVATRHVFVCVCRRGYTELFVRGDLTEIKQRVRTMRRLTNILTNPAFILSTSRAHQIGGGLLPETISMHATFGQDFAAANSWARRCIDLKR